jgi:hypothetical protein
VPIRPRPRELEARHGRVPCHEHVASYRQGFLSAQPYSCDSPPETQIIWISLTAHNAPAFTEGGGETPSNASPSFLRKRSPKTSCGSACLSQRPSTPLIFVMSKEGQNEGRYAGPADRANSGAGTILDSLTPADLVVFFEQSAITGLRGMLSFAQHTCLCKL